MSDPTGHDKPSTSYTAMPANTGGVRIGAITYNELTASLIWPKLFRAFGMSLAPTRLVLGIVAAAILILTMSAADYAWSIATSETVEQSVERSVEPSPLSAGGPPSAFDVRDRTPDRTTPSASPYLEMLLMTWGDAYTREGRDWSSGFLQYGEIERGLDGRLIVVSSLGVTTWGLLGVLLVLPIVVFFGGMISSMVAVDVCANLSQGIGEAGRLTRRRFLTLFRTAAIPVILILAIHILLSLLTLVGFSFGFVSFLSAILWPIGFAIALVQVVLLILAILGGPLTVPAVAIEETDSIDAIQRAYAYVTSRFWRFAGYVLVLFVIWLVASTIVEAVVNLAANEVGAKVRNAVGVGDLGEWTLGLLAWWGKATQVLIWGWSFSFFFTASTILYLLMRQVCDAQDISEIVLEGDRTPSRFVEKSVASGAADASLEL